MKTIRLFSLVLLVTILILGLIVIFMYSSYLQNCVGGQYIGNTYPTWSPDDTKIAFVSNRDGSQDIFIMNTDGSDQTNLTNSPINEYSPIWSPDGTKIAFSSHRDGNHEISVVDNDGSNLINLTMDSPPYQQSLVWSPDGTRIIFTSYRDGNEEIFVVDVDGGNPINLTNSPGTDSNPVWSPDGSKIAFKSSPDGRWGDILVMNIDGSNQTNLTNSPHIGDTYAAWAPDGTKIYFWSFENQRRGLYFIEIDGRNPKTLIFEDKDLLIKRTVSWSSDFTKIVFARCRGKFLSPDQNCDIYIRHLDGTRDVALTGKSSIPWIIGLITVVILPLAIWWLLKRLRRVTATLPHSQ